MPLLTKEQLEELMSFDTPTISNAIERFNIRSKIEGFMSPDIKCILPCKKTIIGYACTAKISTIKPPTPEQQNLAMDYYAKVQETDFPTISVLQDIDPKPAGSFWGEVNATTHKALGCLATITNGGVRDLKEVEELGFGYFASCVLVSHCYTHVEEYDCPVEVGGLTVKPGDLLAADRHGVISIPKEIAPKLADACRKAAEAELPVLNGCRKAIAEGRKVSMEELAKWRAEMAAKRIQK